MYEKSYYVIKQGFLYFYKIFLEARISGMFLCQVTSINEHREQIWKICLCWKCLQLYLSIIFSWKSGDSEFLWWVTFLRNSISQLMYKQFTWNKIKNRTLKEYLSMDKKWTFHLILKYLYQLLFWYCALLVKFLRNSIYQRLYEWFTWNQKFIGLWRSI